MLSLTNISSSRISKEMVFAAAMCTFTGQVFRSGYVSGFSQRLCVGFFAAAMCRPGRLENLRIKLTQTFIKDSVRSGLSLAIFINNESWHTISFLKLL